MLAGTLAALKSAYVVAQAVAAMNGAGYRLQTIKPCATVAAPCRVILTETRIEYART